jgi:hypothetical protein
VAFVIGLNISRSIDALNIACAQIASHAELADAFDDEQAQSPAYGAARGSRGCAYPV